MGADEHGNGVPAPFLGGVGVGVLGGGREEQQHRDMLTLTWGGIRYLGAGEHGDRVPAPFKRVSRGEACHPSSGERRRCLPGHAKKMRRTLRDVQSWLGVAWCARARLCPRCACGCGGKGSGAGWVEVPTEREVRVLGEVNLCGRRWGGIHGTDGGLAATVRTDRAH